MLSSPNACGENSAVVLVVPPVLYPGIPTLGPSILVPACRKLGITARVHYANISFAERVGFEMCSRIAASRTLIGEGLFVSAAFPERASNIECTLDALTEDSESDSKLRQIVKLPPPNREDIRTCFSLVPSFVEDTAKKILSWKPRIVGFSTMVQQTLASVGIARAIKALQPSVVTVLGGANAAEPIGSAILSITDVFDYVFSGECDSEFPHFCQQFLEHGTLPQSKIIRGRGPRHLDEASAPDYDDYFTELEPLRVKDQVASKAPHFLIFESSRGCWWGDKLNCTFCGYNFPGTGYRSKSPDRVVDELEKLISRYGVNRFYASDNIMSQNFPKDVLDRMAEQGIDCSLSYEVKSPIRDTDLDKFVLAGIFEIQPGIESFSSSILKLMLKGVRGLENVRLLRDARSRGLAVVWNILTAIPGEKIDDYEAMLRMLPLLEHLRPPTRWGPIRISRFSPYHATPEKFGINQLRPWQAYYELFGDAAPQIAHHFFGDYETDLTTNADLTARLDHAVSHWINSWLAPDGAPILDARPIENGWWIITDTRAVARKTIHVLAPSHWRVLQSLSHPVHEEQIPDTDGKILRELVEAALVVSHEAQYMSIVTEPAIGERLHMQRMKNLHREPAIGPINCNHSNQSRAVREDDSTLALTTHDSLRVQ